MLRPTNLVVSWTPVNTGDPHAYFNALLAHPKLWRGYSLRDQQQLLDFRQGSGLPADVNYVWPADPDPRKQDAAKVVVPFGIDDSGHGGRTGIRNQCRPPINHEPGHSYLFIWDYWMGAEWAFSHTSMGNDKQFNIWKPALASYLLWQTWFQKAAPGTVGMVTARGPSPEYGDVDTIPPEIVRYLYPERWARCFRLLVPGATRTVYDKTLGKDVTYQGFDTWNWWADEQQEPALIYSQLFFNYPPAGESLGPFGLEYATSQNFWDVPHIRRPRTPDDGVCVWCYDTASGRDHTSVGNHTNYDRGPLVSYVRNLVILRDMTVTDVLPLLQKPVGG